MIFLKVNAMLMIILFLIFSYKFSFVQNCNPTYEPTPKPRPPVPPQVPLNDCECHNRKENCVVSLVNLNLEPVAVSKFNKFIYPTNDKKEITISSGETIILSCCQNPFALYQLNNRKTFEAKCISRQNFSVEGIFFDFSKFECTKNVQHSSRYSGYVCASGNTVEIEIGFDLEFSNKFIGLYDVCFNRITYSTLYSVYNLTRKISTKELVSRPRLFIINEVFNFDVSKLYNRDIQRKTINKQLGLNEGSHDYVKLSSNYYLARGHLTAMADFVYAPQQRATFDYVNVAPQWQTFNGGNWQTLEANVRDYASTRELDLVVYTGTYGITTLPHAETGEETPLYLYINEKGNYGVPVPELFWKVVYDPKRKKGIAFLGVNNPYQKNVNSSIICKDISQNFSKALNWVTWKSKNLTLGYSYICNVNDLRQKIQLPDFEVVDLLL